MNNKKTINILLAILLLFNFTIPVFANNTTDISPTINDVRNLSEEEISAYINDGVTQEELDSTKEYSAGFKIRQDENNLLQMHKTYRAKIVNEQMLEKLRNLNNLSIDKALFDRRINLPDIKGFKKPIDSSGNSIEYFDIAYDFIKNSTQMPVGENNIDYIYTSDDKEIIVNHKFQSIENRNKYESKIVKKDGQKRYIEIDGNKYFEEDLVENGQTVKTIKINNTTIYLRDDDSIYTKQKGKTGSYLNLNFLDDIIVKGYREESNKKTIIVPENTENYEEELRYIRKTYNVVYDTQSDYTRIDSKKLFYGQAIPKLNLNIKKKGGIFQGWKANIDLTLNDGTIIARGTLIDNTLLHSSFGNHTSDKYIIMTAKDIKLTASWNNEQKSSYIVQYWAEKPDYYGKKDAPYRERYDFVGVRKIENVETNSQPAFLNIAPIGIKFPDLDDRITAANQLDKYYKLNIELSMSKESKNFELPNEANNFQENVVKKVSSDGRTTYNVFYDREVYTLIFEKANRPSNARHLTFNPKIKFNIDSDLGVNIVGQPENGFDATKNPYQIKVRFGQSMPLLNKAIDIAKRYNMDIKFDSEGYPNIPIWPVDGNVLGFIKNRYSQGWTINLPRTSGEYRDTPHYRLTKKEFVDINYTKKSISRPRESYGKNVISLGIAQSKPGNYMPIHMDFKLQGLDSTHHYNPELYFWKSDTANIDYPFDAPEIKGFKVTNSPQPATPVGTEEELFKYNENRPLQERSNFKFQKELSGKVFNGEGYDKSNGYIEYIYARNKYTLYLNNNPLEIKETGQYKQNEKLDVFYEKPLKDLNLDKTHIPNKPADMPEDYEFLGWSLDSAGNIMVKNGTETMPDYEITLYAQWGYPDIHREVRIDANGGMLPEITPQNLVDCNALENEGKECELPEETASSTHTKTFNVLNKLAIKRIKPPQRKGYEFLGWENVKYKEDGSEDTSYYDKHKVPEVYNFSNPVLRNIHLRAIWVSNDLRAVKMINHFYEQDGNTFVEKTEKELPDGRLGYNYSAIAEYVNDEYELIGIDKYPNNTFYQNMTIQTDESQNIFNFYYKKRKTNKYKVNYYLEGTNTKIIPSKDKETLYNDFFVENYEKIPGFKLVSAPQYQLIFKENGTIEANFYYKDVRVLRRKPGDPVTPNYQRLIFKTDGNGFFVETDAQGVKTDQNIYVYDVYKGTTFKNNEFVEKLVPATDGENSRGRTKDYRFSLWYGEGESSQAIVNDKPFLHIVDKDYTFVAEFLQNPILLETGTLGMYPIAGIALFALASGFIIISRKKYKKQI